MPTVEERLQTAAVLIDDTLHERHGIRGLSAPPGPSGRSRGLVVGSVAACLVLGLVGLVVTRQRTSEPAVSDTSFTRFSDMPPDEWVAFPELPIAGRFRSAVVATGDGVFVWGGCCDPDSRKSFDDGAYFDVVDGTWRVLPASPLVADHGDAVAAWNGIEVIVVNGLGEVRAAAFNPATFTWRVIAAPAGDDATSATTGLYALPNGRVAFVVTNYSDGLGNGVRVQIYDPGTGDWTAAAAPRDGLSYGVALPDSLHGTAISGEQIAVVSTGVECGAATVDVYDTDTDTWRTVKDIMYPDTAWQPGGIAGLGDGSFLLLGGPCSNGDSQRLAVVVDPDSGTHARVPDAPFALRGGMQYPVSWTGNHVTYLNGDGRLIMFDPAANTWSASEPLPTVAVAAPDGPYHSFPLVWLDGALVVPTVAVGVEPNLCCEPVRAAWAYRPEWSVTAT
ncbi:MAG TPA: kelch repeat-containing protein [Ilumatobacter sp.]|nr:kelch repeat-containing protein [Ilumatobacter sp.]